MWKQKNPENMLKTKRKEGKKERRELKEKDEQEMVKVHAGWR